MSSLWPFFEDRKDAALLFISYVERFYDNLAEGRIELALEVGENLDDEFMEVLNSGFFSEFILKDILQEKLLKQLSSLNPTALILPSLSSYREVLPQFITHRKPRPLITDSSGIFRPNIKSKVIIEPDVDELKSCSSAGCDEVIFKALLLDDNQIERYDYMSRLAVDLGMNVGIGAGFNSAELERILKDVSYINTVYLGRMFFSMAIFEGLENTFKTYLELIEQYR